MSNPILAIGLAAFVLLYAPVAAGDTRPIPRPEHPRPDLQRSRWLNLNGTWQFEIDETGDGEARGLPSGKDLTREIVVPFCPESKLSGIANTDFMTNVWYRRMFEVPGDWKDQRVLLHFGAVDWHARVWLNGAFMGEHFGGNVPFFFDVSAHLRPGENELVVRAFDDTRSGLQACGKQSQKRESYGCVYTRTTGIWQTVWLEAVGQTWLREIALTPDLDGGRLLFQAWAAGPGRGATLRLRASADGRPVGEETVPAAWRNTVGVLKLSEVKPWSPQSPFLYDLTIDVLRDGNVVDSVQSYFGLRKITIEGNRFLINDQPIFQRLVLDQGYYPDGVLTAPSDDALRQDIELSMAAGFNGARLHQKVFEPRFLYWADKLGYLVWGEYPNWGLSRLTPTSLSEVLDEWRTVLVRDRNHPSIIGWCPLNEMGHGPEPAGLQKLMALTQVIDPTRPFLDVSGFVHLYAGTDVYDCHDYNQDPAAFAALFRTFAQTGTDPWINLQPATGVAPYLGQPFFVSEYGGIRLTSGEPKGEGWGYGETDVEGFFERYRGLTDALLDNPNMFGFCYTQITDVEQEQNGVYTFDRKPKYDVARLHAINTRPAAYETQPPRVLNVRWRTVLPNARQAPQEWRYTTEQPTADWTRPDFDDSAWSVGRSGFGTAQTPGAIVNTEWKSSDIWLRRSFTLDLVDFGLARLSIHHDDDVAVYVNGKEVLRKPGWTSAYGALDASDALRAALQPGANALAVHCHQDKGGQFIDVGIELADIESEK